MTTAESVAVNALRRAQANLEELQVYAQGSPNTLRKVNEALEDVKSSLAEVEYELREASLR